MASAVYSEPPASRLSLSLEGTAVSPFPSPSSSFLPPPTPGAHEFAVKPPQSARNGRKTSSAHIFNSRREEAAGDTKPQRSSLNSLPINSNSTEGSATPSPYSMTPTTPTPGSLQRQPTPPVTATLEPPRSPMAYQSTSSVATPTRATTSLPAHNEPQLTALSEIVIPDALQGSAGDVPPSPAFSSTSSRRVSTSISPDLMSNRPAPPSPAVSRRVSGAPSTASSRSRTSRPPSAAVSRANSLRKSTASMSTRGSPVINPHRVSIGSQLSQRFAPLPSPQNLTFSLSVIQPSTSASASVSAPSPSSLAAPTDMGIAASSAASVAAMSTPATPATAIAVTQKRTSKVVFIKIRDFGFPSADERHNGLGPDVPKPNRVGRMNRRLGGRTFSTGSIESSDGDGDGEEDDDDGWETSFGGGGGGWNTFGGLGRLWNGGAGGGGMDAASALAATTSGDGAFPSRVDLDRNFLDDEEEEEGEEYYDAGEDEETLYPGLYRAVYAFEPEGTAEMRLVEDQIVRVVGRGGGVGWAVVVDERETEEATKADGISAPKHALVPESYLEPYKLDWELEEQPAADNGSSSGA